MNVSTCLCVRMPCLLTVRISVKFVGKMSQNTGDYGEAIFGKRSIKELAFQCSGISLIASSKEFRTVLILLLPVLPPGSLLVRTAEEELQYKAKMLKLLVSTPKQ